MLLLELVLLLLLSAVALGWLARRFDFPYPIALVVGGMLLGFVPNLPQFPFDPQLILVVVLPPVLYQAALLTSWTDFRANLRPISLLAIGLVLATTLAVGAAFKALVPDVPWAAAFVLGAIVSPPDAVAATAILSKLNIPRRVVTVLEGESLVNDASGLVIYKFALAAVLTGAFSFAEASVQFGVVAIGGVAIGILLAFVFIAIHKRLDDPFTEVLTSLTIPYTTYILAEHLQVSGVLAVVAAGLVRGRYTPKIVSAEMRIIARSVWNILVFMLNSLIFMLIGTRMSAVIDSLSGYSVLDLIGIGLAASVAAIVVRVLWVYPVAWLPRWLAGSLNRDEPALGRPELGIIGWCGMRGIVSLAAALALPATLPDGSPFPHRDLIVFVTFFVIAATLLGQGLTLPAVIRWLNVGSEWNASEEQRHVRSAMARAALARIDQITADAGMPAEWSAALRDEINQRLEIAAPEGIEATPRSAAILRLRREAVIAQRQEMIRLWKANEISDEVMRHLEEILDFQQAHL
jgi:CPA1 family monovalent cation:H+ antiporter